MARRIGLNRFLLPFGCLFVGSHVVEFSRRFDSGRARSRRILVGYTAWQLLNDAEQDHLTTSHMTTAVEEGLLDKRDFPPQLSPNDVSLDGWAWDDRRGDFGQ